MTSTSHIRATVAASSCTPSTRSRVRIARRRWRSGVRVAVISGHKDGRCRLWHDWLVDDAIARYRAASEANDIDALMDTLAPDAELISPLSGRMVFRGHDDIRALLTAVYGSLR